jgi:hypothetical protein
MASSSSATTIPSPPSTPSAPAAVVTTGTPVRVPQHLHLRRRCRPSAGKDPAPPAAPGRAWSGRDFAENAGAGRGAEVRLAGPPAGDEELRAPAGGPAHAARHTLEQARVIAARSAASPPSRSRRRRPGGRGRPAVVERGGGYERTGGVGDPPRGAAERRSAAICGELASEEAGGAWSRPLREPHEEDGESARRAAAQLAVWSTRGCAGGRPTASSSHGRTDAVSACSRWRRRRAGASSATRRPSGPSASDTPGVAVSAKAVSALRRRSGGTARPARPVPAARRPEFTRAAATACTSTPWREAPQEGDRVLAPALHPRAVAARRARREPSRPLGAGSRSEDALRCTTHGTLARSRWKPASGRPPRSVCPA